MVLYRAAIRAEAAGERDLARGLLRFVLDQYPGTAAAQEAREKLRSIKLGEPPTSGRVELTVWGAIYGAWLGLAVPRAFGAEDPRPYGLGILVGAPSGLLAGRALGRSGPMSLGQARTIRWGSIWGTWQGIGWRAVLDIAQGSEEAPFRAAIAGGLTGIAVAAALARTREIEAATSTAFELASLWGTWFPIASTLTLDADPDGDAVLTAALLGGNAALIATALGAPKLGWSVGRYRLISVIGLAGLLAGFGIGLLFEVEDEQAFFAIPLISSATALAAGVALTRGEISGSSMPQSGSPALLYIGGRSVALGMPAPIPALLPGGHDGLKVRRTPGIVLRLAELSLPW
jgi:hypothetical protein